MLPSCRCGNWLTPDDPRRFLPLSTGGEGLEVIVGLTVFLDVIPLMMFSIQKTNIKEWKGNISEFNSLKLLIVFLHSNSLKSWALQCIMHVQILTSNGEQNSFRTSFCLTWTTHRFLIGKTDILKFSFSFPPQNPQMCFKCVSVTPTNGSYQAKHHGTVYSEINFWLDKGSGFMSPCWLGSLVFSLPLTFLFG